MGKCCTKVPEVPEKREQNIKDKEINTFLTQTDETNLPTFAFLGVGGAGKSTFFRVLKAGNGLLTEHEATKLRYALRNNTLEAINSVTSFFLANNVWEDSEAYQMLLDSDILSPELADFIYKLSTLEEVINLTEEKHKYPDLRLNDSCMYYFTNCQRFALESFLLTVEDVAHASHRTTGIEELLVDFQDNGQLSRVRFIDVGGQRQERKRWLEYLSPVTAVIYVSALNDYVNVLEEDGTTNRMLDSLSLLNVLSDHPALKEKLWVLLLNKTDAFKRIVKKVPIKSVFRNMPEEENSSFNKGKQFLKREFQKCFKGTHMKCHFTCAINADNVTQVFTDVRNFVVRKFFQNLNML